jgi:histidinol-phosphate aminotransferase
LLIFTVGLLDYYRKFQDRSESEIQADLDARRAARRTQQLSRKTALDLASTTWPEPIGTDVVGAIIHAARGQLAWYADPHAQSLRSVLAQHHGIETSQIVAGNGAAELLRSALGLVVDAADEIVMPWPGPGLHAGLIAQSGAHAVAASRSSNSALQNLRDALSSSTKAYVLCNPNDPTGEHISAAQIAALADTLGPEIWIFIDEAYIHFQTHEPEDAVLKLVHDYPNIVVFRTFSKAYGLASLRIGYAVASMESTRLLEAMEPVWGLNALSQTAAERAVRAGQPEIARRRADVAAQRTRILDELAGLACDAPNSQTNFLWLHTPRLNGVDFYQSLAEEGIAVAPTNMLEKTGSVRASLRDENTTEVLLQALRTICG